MKFILLVFVLLLAYGLIVLLLRRLNDTSQRLARLHEDLERNDARLQEQIKKIRVESEIQNKE